MGIINEKYEQEKVNQLQEYLRQYAEREKPIDYEILVDGSTVVRRTDDPELFNLFEPFVNANTKCIVILLYKGKSNKNDRYIYRFNDSAEAGLLGLPAQKEKSVQSQINEAIEKERQKRELEDLLRENSELKDENQALEEEIEELETKVEELEAKQSPLNGFLGDVGSSFVESFIKRNPQILDKLPGGSSLAGLLDENAKQAPAQIDSPVSFTPKSSAMSEDDKASIDFMNQLKERFTQEEFSKILALLESFATDKTQIEEVLNYLTKKQNKEYETHF